MNTGTFILGLLIFIGGLFAGSYTYTPNGNAYLTFENVNENQPLNIWMIPLMIIGIVLMIIGALIPSVTKVTETTSTEIPSRKKVIIREEEI